MKLSVLIPAYNERFLIRELIRRVLAVEVEGLSEIEVVVVDDGSRDGTREILRELAAERAEAALHRASRKSGQGRRHPHRASPRPPVTSSSFRTPISNTTRATIRAPGRPFLEDGADVVYGSRFLASRAPARPLLPPHAGQPPAHLLQQLVHRSQSDRHGDLLQDVPGAAPEVDPDPLQRLRDGARDHRQDRQARVPDLRGADQLSRAHLPRGQEDRLADGFKAFAAMFRYWIVDDLYAEDEYGSHILHSLEKARRLQPLDGRRDPPPRRRAGARDRRRHRQHHTSGCCRAIPTSRATSTRTT